jgi:hypothetical protein
MSSGVLSANAERTLLWVAHSRIFLDLLPLCAGNGAPIFLDTAFIDTPRALIVLSPATGNTDHVAEDGAQ